MWGCVWSYHAVIISLNLRAIFTNRDISKQSNNSIGDLIIINFGGRLIRLVGNLFMALLCCSEKWSCDRGADGGCREWSLKYRCDLKVSVSSAVSVSSLCVQCWGLKKQVT